MAQIPSSWFIVAFRGTVLLSRCDPSASVVRFIEEATVDLTCSGGSEQVLSSTIIKCPVRVRLRRRATSPRGVKVPGVNGLIRTMGDEGTQFSETWLSETWRTFVIELPVTMIVNKLT